MLFPRRREFFSRIRITYLWQQVLDDVKLFRMPSLVRIFARMQKIEAYISEHPARTLYFLLFCAAVSIFTNLGLLALFADEPTRANVALEMILSGNYSVPTVGGEYYYNKPPFYNWLLALVYLVTGSFSEFATRLPAIIPLLFYAATIYYSVAYFLKNKHIALLSGILMIVNGRMLIYDSMLGHIDILYSWITYISFILIFYFYQKGQWFNLFFWSYLLTAIAFLCKGMPSIVFQGFTLLAFLTCTKNLKKLFGWQHILCGLICVGIIGAYFLNYSRFNPNLEEYFSTIWDQSSRRTAVKTGFWSSVKHIFAFPFEHLGHLFPASLLVLFCFHKDFIPGIRKNPFLLFISVVFVANIWVYWLSPETRPRYLFMLYPILFIISAHAYYTYREELSRINKAFEFILLASGILICLSVFAAGFVGGLAEYVNYLWLKIIVIFILSVGCTWMIYRFKEHKIIASIVLLFVIRLAFSWFIITHRHHNLISTAYREDAIEMGKLAGNKDFYFYQYRPAEAMIPFHDRMIFYIQSTRLKKVKFTETDTKPGYYLTFDRDLDNPAARLIKTIPARQAGNADQLKLFEVK